MIKHFCDMCEKEIIHCGFDEEFRPDETQQAIMSILGVKELCRGCEGRLDCIEWKEEISNLMILDSDN